jgi:type IV pilus assembly protein PilQ
MKERFLIRKSVGAALLAGALVLSTEDPPRLVLDFMGAQHELQQNKYEGDARFVKSVRTSQFTSDPEQITRVVFDLNSNVAYKVSNEADAITVRFFPKGAPEPVAETPSTMASSLPPMGYGDTDMASSVTTKPAQDQTPKKAAKSTDTAKPTSTAAPKKTEAPASQTEKAKPASKPTTWTQPSQTQQPNTATPSQTQKPRWAAGQQPAGSGQEQKAPPVSAWAKPADTPASTKTNATAPTQQSSRSFASNVGLARNKNMTIDVQNAHVRTVLRSMSEFSNVNIIAGPEVDAKVTAHLNNVPWRQALDIILRSHGFGWREEYGMIRVSTLDKLTQEELALQAAERQKDDLLPLSTRIMALSYANAEEMRKALKEMLTQRGSIEVERSNNALVVTSW